MHDQSGSALQKASFALLVFIAAALAYLIVRDQLRHEAAVPPITGAELTVGNESNAVVSGDGIGTRPSFAPLRPRTETGILRVASNRTTPSPMNNTVIVGDAGRSDATEASRPGTVVAEVPPTPVALTRVGVDEGVPPVTGRVTLRGNPPPEKQIQLDPMCGRLHPAPMVTRHYLIGRDGGLANVFVYIKSGAPKDASEQNAVPVLDNVACEFQPYVMGVRAGQPIMLRNSDAILHNMHVTPKPGSGNREMNLGMPVKGMSVTKVFDQPEVFIKVKCDVHPWMFAYIGVVEHGWFAVTDGDGGFALPPGLPPGRYTLTAMHLKAGERSQQVNVTDRGAEPVSFRFDVPDGSGTP